MTRACRDHKGNKFPSIKAMCGFWDVSKNHFYSRKALGLPLEDQLSHKALAQIRAEKVVKTEIKDFRGNSYPTLSAMCKKFHTDIDTYTAREREGLSLRECLLGEDTDKRKPIVNQQTSYEDLLDEIKRLEMKISVLSKCKSRLTNTNMRYLNKLTDKVEDAGIAVSSAISYANSVAK